jgi:hypothetical protein
MEVWKMNNPHSVKTYRGYRDCAGAAKVKKRSDGKWRPLRLRLDLANRSPTGFEWGGKVPARRIFAGALIAVIESDEELQKARDAARAQGKIR